MIYFLVGNDNKKKNLKIKALSSKSIPEKIAHEDISKEIILNYASSQSLFGEKIIIVLENFTKRKDIVLETEDWKSIKDSETILIFLEDSLLATEEKKYKKYAEIEHFDKKEEKKDSGKDAFAICDAFARKDKIGAWVLYREAIEKGITPENISGILFWKIKSMILNNNKTFSLDILKKQSSEIVTLHHRAHRGEVDFIIGLEQFILSSLG